MCAVGPIATCVREVACYKKLTLLIAFTFFFAFVSHASLFFS